MVLAVVSGDGGGILCDSQGLKQAIVVVATAAVGGGAVVIVVVVVVVFVVGVVGTRRT